MMVRKISLSIIGVVFFVVFLLGGVSFGRIPAWVLGVYAIFSLLTLIIYAIDKSAAVKGRQRIPEGTLHLLTFAGGWPGAILAQQILRHKTQKKSYRIIFLLTLICNLFTLGWFLYN